jgi:hypothetical protein
MYVGKNQSRFCQGRRERSRKLTVPRCRGRAFIVRETRRATPAIGIITIQMTLRESAKASCAIVLVGSGLNKTTTNARESMCASKEAREYTHRVLIRGMLWYGSLPPNAPSSPALANFLVIWLDRIVEPIVTPQAWPNERVKARNAIAFAVR